MAGRPSSSEFRAAQERLRAVIVRTPLVPLAGADAREILLKPEIHQAVGSFKIRGVHNAVASMGARRRARGLSTVSAGNTAQALAWCARHFGVPARSLMPDDAPATKIDAMRRLGGEPVLVPKPELFRFLEERLFEQEPYAFVHPWTDRDLLIGHGTIGLEILADLPEVRTVFVPVGGGGLIGGVASCLKSLRPGIRVVAVEPEGCAALHASLAQGRPAKVDCRPGLCDGVAVPYLTAEMFPLLREVVDDVVLIPESEVVASIRRLALGNHMIVEGAGALSVAAALATPRPRRGLSVCLVTGGSIDREQLVAILGSAASQGGPCPSAKLT